ncbi:hypothetical protein [Photobacterium phosphoreum]|uniref:hypothetical protein n=1 Tax=Photobacterium phosphoreum TaxID=659 RepID=UPI000D161E8D|nr:hypothetical protein [Photobacterium phosphoreum]PTB33468.1 hypothetical protein DAT36_06330 [Photobacterium phosphoreum]
MFNKKHFWERLSIIAGLVATIVSLYTLWDQTKAESASISISILSNEKVTDIETVPGVKANFTYEGRDVLGLWKIKVRLTNSSDRNLIGVGAKSDLLYDSIPIVIHDQFNVIGISSETDNIGIVLKQKSVNEVEITFEQWSEIESATLIMYLEQMNSQDIEPTIKSKSKSLINGNITIIDNTDNFYTVKKKKPRFEIPNWLEVSTSLIASISIYTWFTIILFLLWSTPYDFIRLKKWQKNYSESFNQHIDEIIAELDHDEVINMLASYKNQPYKAPSWVWENYKGQQYSNTLITETFKSTIIASLIFLIVFVSFMLRILI